MVPGGREVVAKHTLQVSWAKMVMTGAHLVADFM